MRSATGTCVLMLGAAAAGCSLLVASPDDYTYDLTDGAAPARDAGPDAAPLPDAAADGAVPPDASPDGGPDAGCVGAEQACGGACVDVQTDLSHCGRCDRACPERWSCRDSDCHDDVVSVSVASNHACALRASGAVYCWGRNDHGQLGTGDFEASVAPRRVVDLDDAVRLTASGSGFGGWYGTTCVVRRSSEVWCWGANERGQLGDRTMDSRSRPVRVMGLGAASDVHLGLRQACARRGPDPHVVCWGARAGSSDTANELEPTPVPGWPAGGVATSLATVGPTVLAVTGGQLYSWGDALLGDGTAAPRVVARVVPDLGEVAEATVGFGAACVREATGRVSCWGESRLLGVGVDGADGVSTPQEVTSLPVADRIFAGPSARATCSVHADGSVYCWGIDIVESARTGGFVYDLRPALQPDLRSPTAISVGALYACAVIEGDAYCWGRAFPGDGATEPLLLPTRVALP